MNGAGQRQRLPRGVGQPGDSREPQDPAGSLECAPIDVRRQAIFAGDWDPREHEGAREALLVTDSASRIDGDAAADGVAVADSEDVTP